MPPLTFRNCDAKASATAYRVRSGLASWADATQRGFVRGRQSLDSIVGVDARARALTALAADHRLGPEALDILLDSTSADDDAEAARPRDAVAPHHFVRDPLLIFSDFSQAFPSAAHANLRRCIDQTAPPTGAKRYLHRLCAATHATIRLRETTPISLKINAGVAQGCPRSGMVFVIVLDLYLRLVRRILSPTGRVRGFADDIAALVADPLRQPRPLVSIFATTGVAAGLRLEPRKCKVVPLSHSGGHDAARARAQRLPALLAPQWGEFEITTHVTCPVVQLGPGVGDTTTWVAAMRKFGDRATAIADAGLSASQGFHKYATRAAPTLMYIAQVARDLALRTRLVHAPYNAFPQEALFHPELMRRAPPRHGGAKVSALTARARSEDRSSHCAIRAHRGSTRVGPRVPLSISLLSLSHLVHPQPLSTPEPPSARSRPQAACLAAKVADPKRALCEALVRRIGWWQHQTQGSDEEWFAARAALPAAVDRMHRTAPKLRVAFIRSVANGWVTSARAHGATTSCMFGCGDPDAVLHYMRCRPLGAAIEACSGLARAPSVAARFGLSQAALALPKNERFRPPTPTTFQLAVAVDVVHRTRSEADPAAALRSRARDAIRRLRPT